MSYPINYRNQMLTDYLRIINLKILEARVVSVEFIKTKWPRLHHKILYRLVVKLPQVQSSDSSMLQCTTKVEWEIQQVWLSRPVT